MTQNWSKCAQITQSKLRGVGPNITISENTALNDTILNNGPKYHFKTLLEILFLKR